MIEKETEKVRQSVNSLDKTAGMLENIPLVINQISEDKQVLKKEKINIEIGEIPQFVQGKSMKQLSNNKSPSRFQINESNNFKIELGDVNPSTQLQSKESIAHSKRSSLIHYHQKKALRKIVEAIEDPENQHSVNQDRI